MITVDGRNYRAKKMPPRMQMHVMRRLMPILSAAAPIIATAMTDGISLEQARVEFIGAIGPLSEALATLQDADFDYVMDACLLHAELEQEPDKWFPIYRPGGVGGRAMAMYQDVIDAPTELRIVAHVVQENLSGFFALASGVDGSPLNSPQGNPPAA